MLLTLRRCICQRFFGPNDSKEAFLRKQFYLQSKKDTEAASLPLKICLILFTVFETARVIASEIVLLQGPIRWDEVLSRLAFSILISALILVRSFFKKDLSPLFQKIERIVTYLCFVGYCAVITVVIIRRVESLTGSFKEFRDSFDFIALGLLMIPNIVISDVFFNSWIHKSIIPLWQMITLAIVIIEYRPMNLYALLLKIFMYCFYMVMLYWVKDQIQWKVFIQRMTLREWTQIHEKILQNVPDNVAVYDLKGNGLFKNEFLKKFENLSAAKDILEAITNIKKRESFDLPQSTDEVEKAIPDSMSIKIIPEKPLNIQSPSIEFLDCYTFNNLRELFETFERGFSNIVNSKDLFIFDGKCLLARASTTLSIEIRLSIFEDLQDDKKKFLVIIRDTTQRDIIANLESNNNFKDNILASVSHELRTPLNGFTALTEACINDREVLEKTKETYIRPAAKSAFLLGNIINDILDYSLLSRKKLQLRIKKVDVKKLIQACYEVMKTHYYKQRITFGLEIDEYIPETFYTDPERLTQVILNLLSNAFKFTFKGNVVLKALKNNSDIKIIVEDTGVGMDQGAMERLRNIFQESLAGGKISGSSTGIGLGLTISQSLSSLLGPEGLGGLCFKSQLNVGSSFSFLVENKDPSLNLDQLSIGVSKFKSNNKDEQGIMKITSSSFDEEESISLYPQHSNYQEKYFSDYLPSYESRKQIKRVKCEALNSEVKEAEFFFDYPQVLVVDDEPINILALEMIFKQIKLQVDKAYGGEEALELIGRRKQESSKTYKLILLDLNMPLIDGYEVARKIKELVRKKEIEDMIIVACTAYQEYEHREKCLEVGMNDFINKPVTKAKIMEIIERHNIYQDLDQNRP